MPDLVRHFFAGTAASYDRVVKWFTYGMDIYWKRRMLSFVPRAERVLDLACGTGIVTAALLRRLPDAHIVGVDMMFEYLRRARARFSGRPDARVALVCARAEHVRLAQQFDCIVSSYVPKYVAPGALLGNISEYLAAGGVLILHDFAYPRHPLARRVWHAHMRLLRLGGPRLFPEWRNVFFELAELVQRTDWITTYCQALPTFGFEQIRVSRQTAGASAIVVAVKKGTA